MTGVYIRGEQDKMVRIEALLPGFGGFYLDSSGTVVVHMKGSITATQGPARQTLQATYAARPEAAIRQIMAEARKATVIEGQYALSELIAVENRITDNIGLIPGLTGVGTSLVMNRVKVGFIDSASFGPGVEAAVRLGVPQNAIIPEVWGVGRNTSNWDSNVMPTRAGIQISVVNRTRSPGVYPMGSYGFNVTTTTGAIYALIASHTANDAPGINGNVGDSVLQNAFSVPVGVVQINPPWDTNCPINPVTGMPYDFCTDADVAAVRLLPGVTSQRALGTSDYEGQNGAAGSAHIHGWYPIGSVVPPEFILQNPIIGLHKSGYSTGTTTGIIDTPLASQAVFKCFGPPNPANTVIADSAHPSGDYYAELLA